MLNTLIRFVIRRFLESRALKFLEIVKGAKRGRTEDAKMDTSTLLLGIFRYQILIQMLGVKLVRASIRT
jgi:hypothetical protein